MNVLRDLLLDFSGEQESVRELRVCYCQSIRGSGNNQIDTASVTMGLL